MVRNATPTTTSSCVTPGRSNIHRPREPEPPTHNKAQQNQPYHHNATTSFRPAAQEEELEALRQRGLAKLLNRHFTEATQKIAQERAAADAALRDWHGRKGGPQTTSKWRFVQKWRDECRQKERETLLLYQRYVEKFGPTGHVQVPTVQQHHHHHHQNSRNQHHTSESASAAAEESFSLLVTPERATQSAEEVSPATATTTSTNDTSLPASPVREMLVADSVQQLEDTLQRQRRPSTTSGDDDGSPLVNLSESFAKEEAEFRNFYRQALDSEESRPTEKAVLPSTPEEAAAPLPDQHPEDRAAKEEDDDDEEEASLSSLISGLTSVNSIGTRRKILLDCEQTVQTFLKEEGQAVKAMLSSSVAGRSSVHSGSAMLGSIQSQAADEAETMVKQMQGILHKFEEQQKSLASDRHSQGRPFYTPNPDEQWMVYYDETYKREYYHEINTNKTQWEPPRSAPDLTDSTSLSTNTDHSPLLAHVDVMPEVQKVSSRIAAYRRRSRRRRQKRLAIAAALTLTTVFAGVYLVRSGTIQADPWLTRSPAPAVVTPLTTKTSVKVLTPPEFSSESVETTTRSTKTENTIPSNHGQHDVSAGAQRTDDARRQRHAKAMAEAEAHALALHRPPACNLPFAYLVNRRCNRLATENPPYDAFALVQSMMQ